MTESYRDSWATGAVRGAAFDALVALMRRSDLRAARRVAHFACQSPVVASEIARFYDREAEVIGAPVDCERFHPVEDGQAMGDYYLFCGRLMAQPHKRARETVQAFAHLDERLVVAGDGPALPSLRSLATGNVEFPRRARRFGARPADAELSRAGVPEPRATSGCLRWR